MTGIVYWFTGVSAVGKTTVSRLFCEAIEAKGRNYLHLDGDRLRESLFPEAGHSRDDRRRLALAYGRLCKLLADQGSDVVIATISMFHEVQRWNRENIKQYREIYLTAPVEVLAERDPKGVYDLASEVAGVDQQIEVPEAPDICIANDGTRRPEAIAAELAASLLGSQT